MPITRDTDTIESAATAELMLTAAVARGVLGHEARRVQEWLCLQDHQVVVDGDFGPATDHALRRFQQARGLPMTGVVDDRTFSALTAPLRRALRPIPAGGRTFGSLVTAYALQHLLEHPREAGGPNHGPWVRLYMDGLEGHDQPWSGGFVCHVLDQAARSMGAEPPLGRTPWCDRMGADARERGRLIPESAVSASDARDLLLPPGTIVLSRSAGGWSHAGFVLAVHADAIETIEANTNDEGSREGIEVCRRFRGFGRKDFIRIG